MMTTSNLLSKKEHTQNINCSAKKDGLTNSKATVRTLELRSEYNYTFLWSETKHYTLAHKPTHNPK